MHSSSLHMKTRKYSNSTPFALFSSPIRSSTRPAPTSHKRLRANIRDDGICTDQLEEGVHSRPYAG
jgi:hypothetical protein